jgi:C4-dicarboxylate transporter
MSFVSVDQGFLRIKLPSFPIFHLMIKCCLAFCLCVNIPIQTIIGVAVCYYFYLQYQDNKAQDALNKPFKNKDDMMNYVRSQIA